MSHTIGTMALLTSTYIVWRTSTRLAATRLFPLTESLDDSPTIAGYIVAIRPPHTSSSLYCDALYTAHHFD